MAYFECLRVLHRSLVRFEFCCIYLKTGANFMVFQALVCHQGIPITINVIAESVARRLGVRTDPWYRGHFVLMWKSDFKCVQVYYSEANGVISIMLC